MYQRSVIFWSFGRLNVNVKIDRCKNDIFFKKISTFLKGYLLIITYWSFRNVNKYIKKLLPKVEDICWYTLSDEELELISE